MLVITTTTGVARGKWILSLQGHSAACEGSRKQTNQTLPSVVVALIQDLAGNECCLVVWMAMHRQQSFIGAHTLPAVDIMGTLGTHDIQLAL